MYANMSQNAANNVNKISKSCSIPKFELESLAYSFLPEIQMFFKSESGQLEFKAWSNQESKTS